MILAPPTNDHDELNVNLFTSSAELDEYLTHAFRQPFDDGCRTVDGVIGCRDRNVLVSVDLKSERYDAEIVEAALAGLS